MASTDGAFVTAILRLAADIDVRTVAEAVVGFLAHVGVAETPFSHAES